MHPQPLPRIVVDTNTFVSGLISPQGLPDRVLGLWQRGGLRLLTTPELIAEVAAVLSRQELHRYRRVTPERVAELIRQLHIAGESITPLPTAQLPIRSPDPKDDKFLAAALGGGAEYLVTGDKRHLLVLAGDPRLGSLRIVTPRQFLERLGLAES